MTAQPTTSTQTTSTQDAIARVRSLQAALNSAFVEREAEIQALLVALLAREHCLLLGPPGTAKSALTAAFSSAISPTGRYFERLVTKFSVPEELFGPFSLAGLEADRYERKIDGYLPAADVAFLDEVFKANSAILNSLLTLLNERAFDNGTTRVSCPLTICVGASNELPNNSEGDALDALYDRFVLRRWVEPVKSREGRRTLLQMRGAPKVAVKLTAAEIASAQATAAHVTMTEAAEEALLDLQDALARECGIAMSDRRLRKSVKVLQAYAALQGRSEVQPEDLEILADSLWNKPEERAPIMGQIMLVSNPAKAEAAKVFDAAIEAFQAVNLQSVTLNNIRPVSALLQQLREMERTVRGMSDHPSVQAIADDIRKMDAEVARAVAKAMAR